MRWQSVLDVVHARWWWKFALVAGIVWTVFYKRRMFFRVCREWWYDFHDETVAKCLNTRPVGFYGNGFRISELAEQSGRTEQSVLCSLKRMSKDGLAVEKPSGWFGKP
jgi:hypothetical protein